MIREARYIRQKMAAILISSRRRYRYVTGRSRRSIGSRSRAEHVLLFVLYRATLRDDRLGRAHRTIYSLFYPLTGEVAGGRAVALTNEQCRRGEAVGGPGPRNVESSVSGRRANATALCTARESNRPIRCRDCHR